MNSVNITGRMLSPPRITYTQKGDLRAACLVAVLGARGQPDILISVIAWRQVAIDFRDFGEKGEPVIITGSLTSYKDQSSGILRMDVTATMVEFPSRREPAKIKEKGDQENDNP